MRSLDRCLWAIALLTAALSTGCAKSTAPGGWLPNVNDVGSDPYGAWIEVTWVPDDGLKHTIRGELIAVEADSVYVLYRDALNAVATWEITSAVAEVFNADKTGMVGYAILGTFSTASHGYYLILTAPGWILLGSAAAGLYSREPLVEIDERRDTRDLNLAQYARFPQGLPEGLDRTRLAPKPWTAKKRRPPRRTYP